MWLCVCMSLTVRLPLRESVWMWVCVFVSVCRCVGGWVLCAFLCTFVSETFQTVIPSVFLWYWRSLALALRELTCFVCHSSHKLREVPTSLTIHTAAHTHTHTQTHTKTEHRPCTAQTTTSSSLLYPIPRHMLNMIWTTNSPTLFKTNYHPWEKGLTNVWVWSTCITRFLGLSRWWFPSLPVYQYYQYTSGIYLPVLVLSTFTTRILMN